MKKVERIEPVFFLNNEVKQENNKWLSTLEVCMAVCEVLENDIYIEGAQRIGGLWRIYLTYRITRISLFSTGIDLRGIQITLNNRNPFLKEAKSATMNIIRQKIFSFQIICKSRIKLCFHNKSVHYS